MNMNNNLNTSATISQEEHDKSSKFIGLLNGLMEIVFNVSEKLEDNEYLTLCNNLRDLYQLDPTKNVGQALIEIIVQNEVVRENRLRTAMRIRTKKTEILTDYEKLKTDRYKRCPNCSRVITKSYFAEHKRSGVCIKTGSSKKLSAECGECDTRRQEDLICMITGIRYKRNNNKGTGSSSNN
jgi:DNA-directed RNA polymerase subunit RPC12/RpoP